MSIYDRQLPRQNAKVPTWVGRIKTVRGENGNDATNPRLLADAGRLASRSGRHHDERDHDERNDDDAGPETCFEDPRDRGASGSETREK